MDQQQIFELIHGKFAYISSEKSLSSCTIRKSYWKIFRLKQSKLYEKFLSLSGKIFELNWGYGAMHPGRFPTDWVKPSEMEEDGYSNTTSTILSSMDVLERDE